MSLHEQRGSRRVRNSQRWHGLTCCSCSHKVVRILVLIIRCCKGSFQPLIILVKHGGIEKDFVLLIFNSDGSRCCLWNIFFHISHPCLAYLSVLYGFDIRVCVLERQQNLLNCLIVCMSRAGDT